MHRAATYQAIICRKFAVVVPGRLDQQHIQYTHQLRGVLGPSSTAPHAARGHLAPAGPHGLPAALPQQQTDPAAHPSPSPSPGPDQAIPPKSRRRSACGGGDSGVRKPECSGRHSLYQDWSGRAGLGAEEGTVVAQAADAGLTWNELDCLGATLAPLCWQYGLWATIWQIRE
ncbi:hypothetical protein Asppvi_000064 [Aspergillus pseudoviridinutans]|uniref:Uncharacterized protein n=1 Tax=Aspergillus pseudoviridinutans TaxID=1517512 RepID=A0A9P3EQG3_9EURO|nr:uncharacterized protein Asppvi_000064 [Aspergillus pseudoviridinutans]GIJ81565.1 hypothetical protein Asppvi_000064 [Aspergillus pseudoviridinutans]